LLAIPITLGTVLGVAACVATRASLPELTPLVIARGEEAGFSASDLGRGRDLFAARCARCHALPAVDSETRADWEEILPRMARKSGLDREETASVRAFVMAARRPPG
jgi:cytochrome c5